MHINVFSMLLKKDKKGLFGNDDRKGICVKFNFSFQFCTVDPHKQAKIFERFRHY